MPIHKKGRPILTLEDWFAHAGPKRDFQWQDDYSAKEAAQFWLAHSEGPLPDTLTTLLAGHPDFGTVTQWTAEPEVALRFDKLRGEPRNADLVIRATDAAGDFLIAVEAKVNESFGETVADALGNAIERRLANPRSRGVKRIEDLATSLLGARREGEPKLDRLRYQMLTATAGAVAAGAALKLSRVVVLVQEFVTENFDSDAQTRNADDLRAFLRRLSHDHSLAIASGELLGPYPIPGTPLFASPPRVYFGKVRDDVRALNRSAGLT